MDDQLQLQHEGRRVTEPMIEEVPRNVTAALLSSACVY